MTYEQISKKTKEYLDRTASLGKDRFLTDLYSFLTEIAAADGQLDRSELQFIMAIADDKSRTEVISDVKQKISSRNVVDEAIPHVFAAVVDIENDPAKQLGSLPTSRELLLLYEMIGLNLMAADGDTAESETEKYTEYMERLRTYRQDVQRGIRRDPAGGVKEDLSGGRDADEYTRGGKVSLRERHQTPPPVSRDRRPADSMESFSEKWAPKRATDEERDPFAELDQLIGMKNVKTEVAKLVNFSRVQKLREEKGLPVLPVTLHMVFTGNPGTGKTTVARIIGELYAKMGILESGHVVETSRGDLVDMAIGGTAIKTKKKIEEAMGGVLFVDEAYMLTNQDGRDFGSEAVDTILKEMEDHRDEFIVIVAGYPEPMKKFILSNTGLKSRFKRTIEFEDYNGEELYQIFDLLCRQNGISMDRETRNCLLKHFIRLYRNRDLNFANGREVRNFFEDTAVAQSQRISARTVNTAALSTFTIEDLGLTKENDGEKVEALLDELDRMVGLSAVKREVAELIDHVRIQNERFEAGLSTGRGSLHMVFTGNPGTGKTTVARLLAKLFAALNVVTEGQLVEKDRSGLVAGYVGQTALKTRDAVNAAVGGVLFIDEAYSLAREEGAHQFGAEAIDALVKGMEDNRENLVVIAAGYEDEMQQFIRANPGLSSRFTRTIHFEDYTPEEMYAIFAGLCEEKGYREQPKFAALLKAYFAKYPGAKIGNGRGVRNLFEKVVRIQESRLVRLPAEARTPERMQEITVEDLVEALTRG